MGLYACVYGLFNLHVERDAKKINCNLEVGIFADSFSLSGIPLPLFIKPMIRTEFHI